MTNAASCAALHCPRQSSVLGSVESAREAQPQRVTRRHDDLDVEVATVSTLHSTAQHDFRANDNAGKPPFRRAYSFALATTLLFLFSWGGQFIAQAIEVRNEAEQHGQAFTWSDFLPQFLSSTFENWQSEFLQLIWQAIGLALLLLWGSSQSKESDERIEAKLDRLLAERGIDPSAVSREVNENVACYHGCHRP
jgi:hypothetical protein